MTSIRLALATAVLIGLAIIPTVLHSYLDVKTDDGYTAARVSEKLAGLNSRPSDRRGAWMKKFLDSDDWSERNYQKADGGEIRLLVSRSYDLKRLYHHPELAVAYGHDLRDAGVERLAGMTQVPVHVLRTGADHAGLAVYALLYDHEFVDNPYTFQLRTAGALLFSPRRLMTLFFAHDVAAAAGARVEGSPVAQVLIAAIRSYQSQTLPVRSVQLQPDLSPAPVRSVRLQPDLSPVR